MVDMTDQYNTKLSKAEEEKFQTWAEENGRAADLENYDLRGWWKQNGKQDSRGHFTDEFKKPNHPTFSDESKYNGVDGFKGGAWGKAGEKDTFTPSKTSDNQVTATASKKVIPKKATNAAVRRAT